MQEVRIGDVFISPLNQKPDWGIFSPAKYAIVTSVSGGKGKPGAFDIVDEETWKNCNVTVLGLDKRGVYFIPYIKRDYALHVVYSMSAGSFKGLRKVKNPRFLGM